MTTSYTWDIENITILDSHNENEKVVSRVVWKCIATDNAGNSKSQLGVIDLDINNSVDFIPASQVTKQQIINWVTAIVPKEMIENNLMPTTSTTINFSDTDSTTTVSDQILVTQARANIDLS
jgi:hypothetical protein